MTRVQVTHKTLLSIVPHQQQQMHRRGLCALLRRMGRLPLTEKAAQRSSWRARGCRCAAVELAQEQQVCFASPWGSPARAQVPSAPVWVVAPWRLVLVSWHALVLNLGLWHARTRQVTMFSARLRRALWSLALVMGRPRAGPQKNWLQNQLHE